MRRRHEDPVLGLTTLLTGPATLTVGGQHACGFRYARSGKRWRTRPFVVRLLDDGAIPSQHLPQSRHRKVLLSDVLVFQERRARIDMPAKYTGIVGVVFNPSTARCPLPVIGFFPG